MFEGKLIIYSLLQVDSEFCWDGISKRTSCKSNRTKWYLHFDCIKWILVAIGNFICDICHQCTGEDSELILETLLTYSVSNPPSFLQVSLTFLIHCSLSFNDCLVTSLQGTCLKLGYADYRIID